MVADSATVLLRRDGSPELERLDLEGRLIARIRWQPKRRPVTPALYKAYASADLVCRDPALAIDFCVQVFDAVELGRRPGAEVLVPLRNQFWGDRIAWIMDPSGHVWTVATRIEETTAQQRTDRWSATLADKRDA